MKKLLLLIVIAAFINTGNAQMIWDISFDNGSGTDRIIFPNGSSGLWQIGTPSKPIFSQALSSPNVIVTDTSNPYPANDTSSFIVVHIAGQGWQLNYPKIDLGGWYYVDSDSLTDFGYIEFSPDNGNTWSLVDSTNSGCCSWGASQEYPVFTGRSNGWKHFYYCLCTSVPVEQGDTVLYRFTFISDGNQSFKDGLMFDELHFEDWAEGIEEKPADRLIVISPNPAADILWIKAKQNNTRPKVQVLSLTGQVLYEDLDFDGGYIDTRSLKSGIYLLKYSLPETYEVKKFIVRH